MKIDSKILYKTSILALLTAYIWFQVSHFFSFFILPLGGLLFTIFPSASFSVFNFIYIKAHDNAVLEILFATTIHIIIFAVFTAIPMWIVYKKIYTKNQKFAMLFFRWSIAIYIVFLLMSLKELF